LRPFTKPNGWRRASLRAWKDTRLHHTGQIAGCVAISALNLLWQGHGVLKSWTPLDRLFGVITICYALSVAGEFLWLLFLPELPPTIAERVAAEPPPAPEPVDPLIEQLQQVPPEVLKEGTLMLADAMKTFEAGSDQEYLSTLLLSPSVVGTTKEERDEELDKQSQELLQRHLDTWRAYRDRFYRPARAFRDELRKRLGIRNPNREPRIPALDSAVLTGANPITQAADYLVTLARRLK
jgi:hypothetical protein